jgi:thiol:disulfide interchange protein DsbD
MLISFTATWCPACTRMREETFKDAMVAQLLRDVEQVEVDLDAFPALGKEYRVTSMPCVLFVDARGAIVDRLNGFEPPAAFQSRLVRLRGGAVPASPPTAPRGS